MRRRNKLFRFGYDDIQFSAHAQVPLTTVRIPKRELGEKAVEKLLQRIEQGKPAEKWGEKLPVELVIRASTAKEVVKEGRKEHANFRARCKAMRKN